MNNHLYSHELLRTLVTTIDEGSFVKAANLLHQTQPAISLQIKRLEEQAGQALFSKVGRQLVPTAAGKLLADYGRKMLALNLEATHALKGHELDGVLRLSAPQDIAEDYLPDVLSKFSAAFPRMKLEVRVERNQQLVKGITNNDYDVALVTVDRLFVWQFEQLRCLKLINAVKMQWLAASTFLFETSPLPLVLLEPPCLFRTQAIAALDAAKIEYRIAYITASLAGLRAAVEAGLGVTARVVSREDYARSIEPISALNASKVIGSDLKALKLPKLGSLKTFLFQTQSNRTAATQLLCNLLEARLRADS
jgi:DNA-binding transcriptional LysR family regulator